MKTRECPDDCAKCGFCTSKTDDALDRCNDAREVARLWAEEYGTVRLSPPSDVFTKTVLTSPVTGVEPTLSDADKPSNPKDDIGGEKIPFHLWPETASAYGSLALLDGALKYGRANWRAVGVRASIYYDALRRHMNKWFEGEDTDPDSGLPHLAHALACLAILIDATSSQKLCDDRQMHPEDGYVSTVESLTPHVKRLKSLYADRHPKHYSIADTEKRHSDGSLL